MPGSLQRVRNKGESVSCARIRRRIQSSLKSGRRESAKMSDRRELFHPGVPLSREGNTYGWPGAWNNLINQSVSDRLKSIGGFAIAGMVLFTPTFHPVVLHTRMDPGVFPNPLTDDPGQVYLRPRSHRESAKKAKSFIRQWQSENGGLRHGIIMRNQEKSGYDEKSPRIDFENSWTRNK